MEDTIRVPFRMLISSSKDNPYLLDSVAECPSLALFPFSKVGAFSSGGNCCPLQMSLSETNASRSKCFRHRALFSDPVPAPIPLILHSESADVGAEVRD